MPLPGWRLSSSSSLSSSLISAALIIVRSYNMANSSWLAELIENREFVIAKATTSF
jgi:hypothetical protein